MTVRLTRPFYSDCHTGNCIPNLRTTRCDTAGGPVVFATLFRYSETPPTPAQLASRAAFAATYAGQVTTPAPLVCPSP